MNPKHFLFLAVLCVGVCAQGQATEDSTIHIRVDTLSEVSVKVAKKNIVHQSGKTIIRVDGSPYFLNARINDILSLAPEIAVVDEKISVLGKDKVFYLINGRETFLKIENLVASQIDSIEIMSSIPAKYQSKYNAVINIHLKKSTKDKQENITLSSQSTYNEGFSSYLTATYSRKIKRLDVYANVLAAADDAAFRYHENGYQNFKDYRSTFNLRHTNFVPALEGMVELQYEIDSANAVGLSVYSSISTGYQNIYSDLTKDWKNNSRDDIRYKLRANVLSSTFPNLIAFYNYTKGKWSNNTYFSYLMKRDDEHNFSTNVFRQNESKNYTVSTDNLSSDQGLSLNSSSSYQIKGQTSIEFGGRWDYITGNLSFKNEERAIKNENEFGYTEMVSALFVQLNTNVKSFDVLLGLRYEYFNRDVAYGGTFSSNISQGNWLPSFSISRSLNKHQLGFSFSNTITRVPLLAILPSYGFYLNNNQLWQGNPQLKPSVEYNVNVSYSYNNQLFISPYFSFENNRISYTAPQNDSIFFYYPTNYDRLSYGINLSYNIKLFKDKLSLFNKVDVFQSVAQGMVKGVTLDRSNLSAFIYFMQSYRVTDHFSIVLQNYYSFPGLYEFSTNYGGWNTNVKLNYQAFQKKLSISLSVRDIFNSYSYGREYGLYDGYTSYTQRNSFATSVKLDIVYKISNTNKNEKKSDIDQSAIQSRLGR